MLRRKRQLKEVLGGGMLYRASSDYGLTPRVPTAWPGPSSPSSPSCTSTRRTVGLWTWPPHQPHPFIHPEHFHHPNPANPDPSLQVGSLLQLRTARPLPRPILGPLPLGLGPSLGLGPPPLGQFSPIHPERNLTGPARPLAGHLWQVSSDQCLSLTSD